MSATGVHSDRKVVLYETVPAERDGGNACTHLAHEGVTRAVSWNMFGVGGWMKGLIWR